MQTSRRTLRDIIIQGALCPGGKIGPFRKGWACFFYTVEAFEDIPSRYVITGYGVHFLV